MHDLSVNQICVASLRNLLGHNIQPTATVYASTLTGQSAGNVGSQHINALTTLNWIGCVTPRALPELAVTGNVS